MTSKFLHQLLDVAGIPDFEKRKSVYESIGFLDTLMDHRYREYLPTQATQNLYRHRLVEALLALPVHLRIDFVDLASRVMFVGETEFCSLYKTCLSSVILPWIIDEFNIDILSDYESTLKQAVSQVCFMGLTDSMELNAFMRVNNLAGSGGANLYLDTICEVSACDTLITKLKSLEQRAIVIVEDFIGSGTTAMKYLPKLLEYTSIEGIKVLSAPMMACPESITKLQSFEFQLHSFRPTLTLSSQTFVSATAKEGEDDWQTAARQFISLITPIIYPATGHHAHATRYPYLPLGFKEGGCLVVMKKNCPNNTLPMFWYNFQDWPALFPRVERAYRA